MSGIFVSAEQLALRSAIDNCVSAAAALQRGDDNGKAAALIHLGIALVMVARTDPDEAARALAESIVEKARASGT